MINIDETRDCIKQVRLSWVLFLGGPFHDQVHQVEMFWAADRYLYPPVWDIDDQDTPMDCITTRYTYELCILIIGDIERTVYKFNITTDEVIAKLIARE
jgi:hypothetical protein